MTDMAKRDRRNSPALRVPAPLKAKLDQVKKAQDRPITYGQLIEKLLRATGLWVHPDRRNWGQTGE